MRALIKLTKNSLWIHFNILYYTKGLEIMFLRISTENSNSKHGLVLHNKQQRMLLAVKEKENPGFD